MSSATRRDIRNVKVPRSIVKEMNKIKECNFTFLPMPVTQRVQPQLLRSLNTPLALLKGCLQV